MQAEGERHGHQQPGVLPNRHGEQGLLIAERICGVPAGAKKEKGEGDVSKVMSAGRAVQACTAACNWKGERWAHAAPAATHSISIATSTDRDRVEALALPVVK